MTYQALIVDDNADVLEMVEDILDSLGHAYDCATCQDDARKMLLSKRYSYYLVDLEIPVKKGRGFPRIQNGENLIREIVQQRGADKQPIIVMTGHGTNAPKLVVQMMKLGVDDYVTKPFETSEGNALDKAIKEALLINDRGPVTEMPKVGSQPSVAPAVFSGGEMVFCPERVELLGVRICGGKQNGMIRGILDILREKKANSSYLALSGLELAERLGCPGEQNKISSCIGRFRKSVVEVLRTEAGLKCGPQDVIQSGDQGYRLHESIEVWTGDNHSCISKQKTEDNLDAKRRNWILAELTTRRVLRRHVIAKELKCSLATVKRDLDALRIEGQIEFVGPAKTGFYQLKHEILKDREMDI